MSTQTMHEAAGQGTGGRQFSSGTGYDRVRQDDGRHGAAVGMAVLGWLQEIVSTAQLRGEAARAESVLEEFTELIQAIGAWVNALPDRYTEAPFGTTALSMAINHITEAGGDAAAIGEGLRELEAALNEADGLGESVSAIAADGDVEAFKAQ